MNTSLDESGQKEWLILLLRKLEQNYLIYIVKSNKD